MPMIPDVSMSDATFADFTDAVKLAEADGISRADIVEGIIVDGLKPYQKRIKAARAAAAEAAEQAQQ